MKAPGKTMLQVISILFIIFGALDIILSLLAVIGSAASSLLIGVAAGLLVLLSLYALAVSIVMLVIGILGVGRCADPAKGKFFINMGIILCVLEFISLVAGAIITGFSVISLIGFVLPILFIVGGNMNKNAVNTPAAPVI